MVSNMVPRTSAYVVMIVLAFSLAKVVEPALGKDYSFGGIEANAARK